MTASHPARRAAAAAVLAFAVAVIHAPPARAQGDAPPAGLEQMRAAARELLLAGDYHRAIQAYRAIVEHTNGDSRSHYELGAAFAFLRMYLDALEPIEEAVRLDPDDVRFQEMAAIVYFHLKRDEEGFAATLRMAELGDVPAMYTLVDFYERGRGVAPDQAKALMWAERAADGGHVGAMSLMEMVYREGRYAQRVDVAKADAWAERRQKALESMN